MPSEKMDVHFSSKSAEWATPRDFYRRLNARWQFTLDPACTKENAVTPLYYTVNENGLIQNWGGHRVFLNPPYGRGIGEWIEKCYQEMQRAVIVALIPARTDTTYYHDFIDNKRGVFVHKIKGRLHFNDGKDPAPFPSMLVYFLGEA